MSNDNVFPLRPSPKDVSDTGINSLWEYAVDLTRKHALNAESMFSDIDLKRRYQIKAERRPSLYRLPEWFAIDELTFDDEPLSRWHIIGTGQCEEDAKLDLLEKLTAEYARD